MKRYGVIIIGGGHAGCEAAHASARLGVSTLLLTMKIETIGQMSCNPAIGGIGKSHLAREVDALDGLMCKIADNSALQRRTLNSRKGPAVRATRIQTCRNAYKRNMQKAIQETENLDVLQSTAAKLIVKNNRIEGVVTEQGEKIYGFCVVMTVGTFLGGKIHIGNKSYSAGRSGDKASNELEDFFLDYPFLIGKLKTGTPPRIKKQSINFQRLESQVSDAAQPCMSYLYDHYKQIPQQIKQIPCYITYTNRDTHDIIRNSKDLSPLYNGAIEATGPRYCPSIEDKVEKFKDKAMHQVFLEPETSNNFEIYPNGLSTSLPVETQYEFLQTIKGLENCILTQPGYAIEYSYFDPRCLDNTLETKHIENLFFAGQINGTTGYEEAAAQGILAGINASLKYKGLAKWSPQRNEAYMGVLVDDLITLGVLEPYRMFTSRAEHRLRLREDNADERLTEKGFEMGVVSDERVFLFREKLKKIENESKRLKGIQIKPGTETCIDVEKKLGIKLKNAQNLKGLLKISNINYKDLNKLNCFGITANSDIGHLIANNERYEGYLKKQDAEMELLATQQKLLIPKKINYKEIKGLTNEAVEALSRVVPSNIEQAKRIPGVTPATISLLRVFIKKNNFN